MLGPELSTLMVEIVEQSRFDVRRHVSEMDRCQDRLQVRNGTVFHHVLILGIRRSQGELCRSCQTQDFFRGVVVSFQVAVIGDHRQISAENAQREALAVFLLPSFERCFEIEHGENGTQKGTIPRLDHHWKVFRIEILLPSRESYVEMEEQNGEDIAKDQIDPPRHVRTVRRSRQLYETLAWDVFLMCFASALLLFIRRCQHSGGRGLRKSTNEHR